MLRRFCSFSLFFLLLVLIATACSRAPAKPTVVLNSPPHGSQFHEGEPIAFQTTATDPSGIARVELLVNGSIVQTDTVPSQAQTTFALVQHWTATQGTQMIAVRAYNAANVMSDPAVISITVLPAAATPSPVPTAVPPTRAPTPTSTATATATATTAPPTAAPPPSGCTNNATFVADVTVPDGTLLAANQTFNKIWRVRNNGTCTWGNGYLFVFIGGEAMATTTAIAVPHTAPGATADLLVAMAAPAAAGIHSGQWRLKSPEGNLFGVTVNVTINVLGGAPPPATTEAPPPSGSTCTGSPSIASFTADPTGVFGTATSTLSWGAVTNADSVEIDHGIGGVPAPGNVTVSPATTTTYTLTAHCGANTAQRQVTVTKLTYLPRITPGVIIPPGSWLLLFQVTNVTASASKTCHFATADVTFSGQITTNRDGDVVYKWEGAAPGGPTTLHFTAAGTKSVSIPRTFVTSMGSGHWTNTLHVTSPNDKSASVTVNCP